MKKFTREIIEKDTPMLWWGKPSEMSPKTRAKFIETCDRIDNEFGGEE